MISPKEIKEKAIKRYIPYLQSIILNIPFAPIIIRGDKNYTKSLAEYEKELLPLINHSKEKKGYGFSIDYQTVKTRSIGKQSLPSAIYFSSELDFLKYLGKEREQLFFLDNYKCITTEFPKLRDWCIKNPLKIVRYEKEWDSLIKVCKYFRNNPQPNLYIRELPIRVHTKFIESNVNILRELLDIIIEDFTQKDFNDFERRFNLKYQEPLIRFKILDELISRSYFSGLNDLAIPISDFIKLKLPVTKVLLVENKTSLYTTLTLPNMHNSIAIFGGGYSVHLLKNVAWLNEVEVLYWGDIDVQGIEILSQFREYFSHTRSILMDLQTFNTCFENDAGKPSSTKSILTNLYPEEEALYSLLKANNWRLEQEKIPYGYINATFDRIKSTE